MSDLTEGSPIDDWTLSFDMAMDHDLIVAQQKHNAIQRLIQEQLHFGCRYIFTCNVPQGYRNWRPIVRAWRSRRRRRPQFCSDGGNY